jgi:hypothetical protein
MTSVTLLTPGLAAADMPANRGNGPVPSSIQQKHNALGAQEPGTNGRSTRGHGSDGHHRNKVLAIVVYVPETRPVNAPYYYAPDTPAYVDQDPPDGAYRELNGFYYWCSDPAGYYPYQPDCPTGWRLVAP